MVSEKASPTRLQTVTLDKIFEMTKFREQITRSQKQCVLGRGLEQEGGRCAYERAREASLC